jgi:hypothetical protein
MARLHAAPDEYDQLEQEPAAGAGDHVWVIGGLVDW